MADVINYQRFWQRRGTAANWASVNPTLASGEIGVETDTGRWKLGDGSTAWNAKAYQLYDAPSDGTEYVRKNGAWFASAGGGGGGQHASASAYECWDFVSNGVAASSNTGSNFVTNGAVPVVYTAGTGAGASLTGAAGSPAICTLTTGTTSTGYARMFFCPPVISLGGGEIHYKARIRIPTLSDATNRFGVGIVMANVISGTLQRIGSIYVDNVNSGRWVADAFDAVGNSTANSSIAPSANTWTTVELRPNSAGTSFTLYIDGVSAATVSANVPIVGLGLGVQITKSAGSTARTVDVDFGEFLQEFSAPR